MQVGSQDMAKLVDEKLSILGPVQHVLKGIEAQPLYLYIKQICFLSLYSVHHLILNHKLNTMTNSQSISRMISALNEYTVSILGQDEGYMVNYSLSPEGVPRVKPDGGHVGEGLYLTVYPESSPNKDIISFLRSIMITFCIVL